MLKIINLFIFGLIFLSATISLAKEPTKPKLEPGLGDLFWEFNGNLYQSKTEANNKFGTMFSQPTYGGSFKVSQQFSKYFRPYLMFGDTISTVTLPWDKFKDLFFDAGFGTEITVHPRIKFDLGVSANQQMFFTEEDTVATYYKDFLPSLNFKTYLSIIKSKHFDFGVAGAALAPLGNSTYGVHVGYGYQSSVFLNQTYGNFTLKLESFYQRDKTNINGTKQQTTDFGGTIGLGWRFPYKAEYNVIYY